MAKEVVISAVQHECLLLPFGHCLWDSILTCFCFLVTIQHVVILFSVSILYAVAKKKISCFSCFWYWLNCRARTIMYCLEEFIIDRSHVVFTEWHQKTGSWETLKGTVSRDFSCPVFFYKHLLLVPIGMPRTDFDFFRILVELFVFVIDSPAMNTGESIRIL